MDRDLLVHGYEVPILEDETEEKCDIPIDSDIEKMRAKEDELEDELAEHVIVIGGSAKKARQNEKADTKKDESFGRRQG